MKRIHEVVDDEIAKRKEDLKEKPTWKNVIVKGVESFEKEERKKK